MRKLLTALLIFAMVFSAVACGNEASKLETESPSEPVDSTQPGLIDNVDFEQPNTENTAILYNPMHSSYDATAEERRLAIVNAEDTIQPTSNTVYVSYRGDDKNDGRTPETAWATVSRLIGADCDTVLFERGGIYRGTLNLVSNTSYGAYGEGPKPCFYTGKQNYADANLWKQTSAENIWALRVGSVQDVGSIVFNDGEKVVLKMMNTYKNLTADYQFYHHHDNGVIYLYLSEGNPGELFDSIEIATGHGARAAKANSENIIVENLCVKYSGKHGISFMTGAKNIVVRNCEIGYIGGSVTEFGRLGNGVEFINSYSDCTVENCWIYQCYDAGYSFQNPGTKDNVEHGMILKGNLIEYCVWNIEIYGPEDGLITDCEFSDNISRFAGYGWGVWNRIGSDPYSSSTLNLYKGIGIEHLNSDNFVIKDNVFDTSRYPLVSCAFPNDPEHRGPTIIGNTYIQQNLSDTAYGVLTSDGTAASKIKYGSATQKELEEAIKKFDAAPKEIILE